MTKTAKPPAVCRGKTYVRDLENGVRLIGSVSPCVFMYHGYPLQVTVELTQKDGTLLGEAHTVDRALNAQTATEADVRRLLSTAVVKPCARCTTPAFDPTTVETNREGLCENCFFAEVEARFAADEIAELKKVAERDRQMKAKGKRFRVTAWIHSDDDDDDQVDWYFSARPTPARIKTLLRKEGSSILNDYQVIRL